MGKVLGILCLISAAWGADAAPDRIRDAAAKGVALIQSSQKSWYSKMDCVSCHQQVLPALAFRAAREHGVAVNEALAHAEDIKSFRVYANLDRAVQYTHVIAPAMDDGYRLLAANAAGVRPNVVTAVYARLVAVHQESDGSWLNGDQRPPQSYSRFTSTAVSLRALQLYGHPSLAADTKARVERARMWLSSNSPRDTEDRTMQMLGLAWAGAEHALLNKLAGALNASQQADGGWNSLDGRSSDVYSTGEVLVALHDAAGVPTSDPAWQRGVQYLLSAQAPDGSWHVVSRLHPPAPVSPPYFETGYPYGHDQFISTAGASWAVQALAAALGPARQIEVPELHEAAPVSVEPWAETVLFGGTADLRALLEKKFDPNSATQSGGTTALMMAAPDLEKTRLLLDRGAKVNARAKTRYSALLVAAQYPAATPVMRLLLDRGAEVGMAKGAGAPLFHASPMMLAAYAGNSEILPRLREAGDTVNTKMTLLGLAPVAPLIGVIAFGKPAVVRALLDCGEPVDEADDDGISALGWAAISNQVEVARVLIERGADVNHVDKKGMTPLLYAASIDFGESGMVDLLLKSGAKAAARTKDGLTAAELAHKFKHTHLQKSLGAGA